MLDLSNLSQENLERIQKVLKIVLDTIELQGLNRLAGNKIPLKSFEKERFCYDEVKKLFYGIDKEKRNIIITNEYLKERWEEIKRNPSIDDEKEVFLKIYGILPEELENYLVFVIKDINELKSIKQGVDKKLKGISKAKSRAEEIRRQFEELNERQKELKELEEHIYSRISKELNVPIQYFKTYEEIRKKISEQLAPLRNALEEISRLQSTTKNYLTPTLQRLTASIKQIEEQIKKVNEIYEGTKTPNVSILPSAILKTKQNAEIISELRNINNKIEGLITQKSIPVKITEIPELKIKKSEAKKKPIKETILYLNQNGDLYREPKEKYCYPMGEKSNRHRIIRFLATNKGYQLTGFISTELGIESKKTIRTEIGKIRKNIEKYLKIKSKDFLQGKKESGYRINPKYKVILRNNE